MKKISMFLCCAFLIMACSDDKEYYDPVKIVEQKEAEYAAGFAQRYGEIAANQDWGFGSKIARGANPNSNEWADIKPGDITTEEVEKVTQWFKDNQNPISISVNWTDFFVQYVAGSRSNMDQLVTKSESGVTEHVNNFNANNSGSIMLMQNSSTYSFGYHNSLDGEWYYNYTIQYIDGAYYVGLDFEAHGQNSNQQEAADGYYNDWIVKISPAVYKDAKRIIAEDLGSSDDFDFNDVVFDVALLYDATVITLQAAGGTLPLYIQVDNDKREVHELFGVSETTMVNTMGSQLPPVMFRLPKCNHVNDVKVVVEGKEASYELKAEEGKAPHKICVDVSYEWTAERQRIDAKYPNFNDWVNNPDVVWY